MKVKRLMTQSEFSKELEKSGTEFCVMSDNVERLVGKNYLYHKKYADFTISRNLRIRYNGGKWQKPYVINERVERFVRF